MPEKSSKDKLRQAIANFGLPENFDVRSFENLVASCEYCNKLKSDHLPHRRAETLVLTLQKASIRADKIRENIKNFKKLTSLSKLKTSLRDALRNGEIKLDDVYDTFTLVVKEFQNGSSSSRPPLELRIVKKDKSNAKVKPDNPEGHSVILYDSYFNSARNAFESAHFSTAESFFVKAREEVSERLGDEQLQRELLLIDQKIAETWLRRKNYSKALKLYKPLIRYFETIFGVKSEPNGHLCQGLATCYMGMDAFAEAVGYFELARKIWTDLNKEEAVRACELGLLNAYVATGNLNKADVELQKFIRFSVLSGQTAQLTSLLDYLADTACFRGYCKFGVYIFDKLYSIVLNLPTHSYWVFDALSKKARCLAHLEDFENAIRINQYLVANTPETAPTFLVAALLSAGRTYVEADEVEKATVVYERAMRLLTKTEIEFTSNAEPAAEVTQFLLDEKRLLEADSWSKIASDEANLKFELMGKNADLVKLHCQTLQAEVQIALGENNERNVRLIESSIRFFERRGMSHIIPRRLLVLGESYMERADMRKSMRFFSMAEEHLTERRGCWNRTLRRRLWNDLLSLHERLENSDEQIIYKGKLFRESNFGRPIGRS
ncbi:hypothetical protein KF728_04915 [Candidatus Obscuribacterales bacterium]|nr:hypothetical protein [Candidatus Obscuribacterales bacterium]